MFLFIYAVGIICISIILYKNLICNYCFIILGLLNVGDTILEVNGVEVHTPIDLQQQLNKSLGSVTFKIRPSNTDTIAPAQVNIFKY